jgi:hypothetical protein
MVMPSYTYVGELRLAQGNSHVHIDQRIHRTAHRTWKPWSVRPVVQPRLQRLKGGAAFVVDLETSIGSSVGQAVDGLVRAIQNTPGWVEWHSAQVALDSDSAATVRRRTTGLSQTVQ